MGSARAAALAPHFGPSVKGGNCAPAKLQLAAVFVQSAVDNNGHPICGTDPISYLARFCHCRRPHATCRRSHPPRCEHGAPTGSPRRQRRLKLMLGHRNPAGSHRVVGLYDAREHLHAPVLLTDTLGDDRQSWLNQRLPTSTKPIEALVTPPKSRCPPRVEIAVAIAKALGYPPPTPTECVTGTSASEAFSSAPASW